MIRSMTGYGSGEAEIGGRKLFVEMKSVNHRFFNLNARLPQNLQRFEGEISALLKKLIKRGQVSVFASWDSRANSAPTVNFNMEAAREATGRLKAAASELGIHNDITFDHLLSFPAVLQAGQAELPPEELWALARPVFEKALADLDNLRLREGVDLARDLRERSEAIRGHSGEVAERSPLVKGEYKQRLSKRIEELSDGISLDLVEERVSLEVAVFADKIDINEEIVRLGSHLDKFEELLDDGGNLGRKLEFLIQEMNREVNTIGSKGTDAETSRLVVEMKTELEKIREQVQNME